MAYIYNEKVKSATDITAAYNARLEEEWDEQLKLQERRDVENARKHIILPYSEDKWEKFGKRPDSVNPYLWQSRINAEFAGVYRMADDYYVVTGAAVSEIAFIKGKTGWVAIDTGANETEAAISTELAERASGEAIRGNITALIITHTHY